MSKLTRFFTFVILIIFTCSIISCTTTGNDGTNRSGNLNQQYNFQTHQGVTSMQVATVAGVTLLVGAGIVGLFLLSLPHVMDGANLCK